MHNASHVLYAFAPTSPPPLHTPTLPIPPLPSSSLNIPTFPTPSPLSVVVVVAVVIVDVVFVVVIVDPLMFIVSSANHQLPAAICQHLYTYKMPRTLRGYSKQNTTAETPPSTLTAFFSASDRCALQEALYKCIDTIQYNTIRTSII